MVSDETINRIDALNGVPDLQKTADSMKTAAFLAPNTDVWTNTKGSDSRNAVISAVDQNASYRTPTAAEKKQIEYTEKYRRMSPEGQNSAYFTNGVIDGTANVFDGFVSAMESPLGTLLSPLSPALKLSNKIGELQGKGEHSVSDALHSFKQNAQSRLDASAQFVSEDMKKYGGTIAEGIGYTLPSTVLAMATGGGSLAGEGASWIVRLAANPQFWMSFVPTYGNSYADAKKDGASELEAKAFAVLNAFPSAAVEIGGGIETIPQTAPTIKTWIKGMLEEGGEEVIQGVIEQLAKKAVYLPDKEWFSLVDSDAVINPYRMFEEGFGGALVGGVMGGGEVLVGKMQLNAQYAKAGTETLQNPGGLETVLAIGMTNAPGTDVRAAAEKLSAQVQKGKTPSATAIGRILVESGSESAQKSRTVYQQVLQSAMETGAAYETAEAVGAVAAHFGRETVFISPDDSILQLDGQSASGAFDEQTGRVYVNSRLSNEEAVDFVLKHELTHSIEGSRQWSRLSALAKEAMGEAAYFEEIDKTAAARQSAGDTTGAQGAEKEVVADWVGKNLYRDGFAQAVVEADGSLGSQFLSRLWSVRRALAVTKKGKAAANVRLAELAFAKALESTYRRGGNVLGDVETVDGAVKEAFPEAFVGADERAEIEADAAGVQYSIQTLPDGQKYVHVDVDQSLFDGLSDKEKLQMAEEVIRERFVNKVIGGNMTTFVNGQSAREYANPAKHVEGDILNAKARVSTELDHLLEAATNWRHVADGQSGHVHPNATGGFYHGDVLFEVAGQMYQGRVNILVNNKGRLLKDITQIKEATKSTYSSIGKNPKSVSQGNFSNPTLPQDGNGVNSQSMQNSQKDTEKAKKGVQRAILPAEYEALNTDDSPKTVMREHRDEIERMEPVFEGNADFRFVNRQDAVNHAVQFVGDGVVYRQDIGEIVVDRKRISRGISYLETETDIMAFTALRDLLEKGKVYASHVNHKNRGYSTMTIAAPIVLNGERLHMGAVVRLEPDTNYYKVHRILLPDGREISLNTKNTKEEVMLVPSRVAQNETNPIDAQNITSEDSIAENGEAVKREISENGVQRAILPAELEQKEQNTRRLAESETESETETGTAQPVSTEKRVSRKQTATEIVKDIGDMAAYRRLYRIESGISAADIVETDGERVSATAYIDRFSSTLPQERNALEAVIDRLKKQKTEETIRSMRQNGEPGDRLLPIDLQLFAAEEQLTLLEIKEDGEKVRKFIESRLKGQDANSKPEFLEYLAGRKDTYDPIGNKKTVEKAKTALRNPTYIKALEKRLLRHSDGDVMSMEDLAAAQIMANDALNDGDLERAVNLMTGIARKGTEAGRAVQILSVQSRLTPEGTLRYVQKVLKKEANTGLFLGADGQLDRVSGTLADRVEAAAEKRGALTPEDIQAITKEVINGLGENQRQLKRLLKERLGDFSGIAEMLAAAVETDGLNDISTRQMLEKAMGLPTLTDADIKMIVETVQEIKKYGDFTQEQSEAIEKLYDYLGKKLPVSKSEKWQAWRKFSMLANPKTHIRNIFSNIGMYGVQKMDSVFAQLLEKIFLSDKNQRTAAVGWSFTEHGRSIREQVRQAEKKAVLQMQGTGKYNLSDDAIRQHRQYFKNPLLEKASNWNSNMLEKEDVVAFKPAFRDALGQIMTARNMTEVTQEVYDIAMDRALEATFRANNALHDAISSIKHTQNNVVNLAMDIIIPFSKTPANIMVQSAMHSPIGVVKASIDLVQQLRGKSAKTTSAIINEFAKGLSGSVLMAIGLLLGKSGLFTTKYAATEKERAAYELEGKQANALQIGRLSITMDWLQPTCAPLIFGASLGNSLAKDGVSLASVFGGVMDATDSLFELTMLQSLYDVAGGYNKGTTGAAASVIENLMSQSIPTLVGQTARSIDPVQRRGNQTSALTGITGDNAVTIAIQEIMLRIPGLTYLLEPEMDVWGNTVYRTGEESALGAVLNIFQQLVSPANIKVKPKDDSGLNDMLMQLYNSQAANHTSALPTSLSHDKAKELGVDYRETYRRVGQAQRAAVVDLVNNRKKSQLTITEIGANGKEVRRSVYKYWQDMTDEEKLRAIGKLYTKEKEQVLSESDPSDYMKSVFMTTK